MSSKIVIGMTGPFGSGCTYISREIIEKMGYEYISLSDILRSELGVTEKARTELQDAGNQIRNEKGYDYLAQKAIEHIDNSTHNKFVVDSIRNTHEVDALQRKYASFYLFAVWASKEKRWERISTRYDGNLALFEKDDKRDQSEKNENGQQITLCYLMADIIIINNQVIHSPAAEEFTNLSGITKHYISLIERTESFVPSEMETLMTMAYANSMRSSCLQRKVGALIIDNKGNVFSSGYNEVPSSEKTCRSEYGMCYRRFLKDDIGKTINSEFSDAETANKVFGVISGKFKNLDHCRALHAEENAIVNMAKCGVTVNFGSATLYTTTYPCNLCANKIAQVGIKTVVYYEPYPQKEAKSILSAHKVNQIPFEGVTYNGYFRFREVLR